MRWKCFIGVLSASPKNIKKLFFHVFFLGEQDGTKNFEKKYVGPISLYWHLTFILKDFEFTEKIWRIIINFLKSAVTFDRMHQSGSFILNNVSNREILLKFCAKFNPKHIMESHYRAIPEKFCFSKTIKRRSCAFKTVCL